MIRDDLPDEMKAEYRAIPDWAVNLAFAEAFEWLVWKMDIRDIPREQVGRQRLLDEADKIYDMIREDWEAEE